MNTKIRRKLAARKRRIQARLDKRQNAGCDQPMLRPANIQYELADRTRGHVPRRHRLDAAAGAAAETGRSHRCAAAPAEDPSAVPRERPRAELRVQRLVRRDVSGRHRTAPQRRGVSRRDRRAAHSRSDHGRRLLPALSSRACPHAARRVQRRAAEGLGRAARRVLRRGADRHGRHDWCPPTASARKAWTSTTRVSGVIIRWWCRWPTPARC